MTVLASRSSRPGARRGRRGPWPRRRWGRRWRRRTARRGRRRRRGRCRGRTCPRWGVPRIRSVPSTSRIRPGAPDIGRPWHRRAPGDRTRLSSDTVSDRLSGMSDISDMLSMEVEDPRAAIFLDPRTATDAVRWHEVAAELRRNDPVFRVEHELLTPVLRPHPPRGRLRGLAPQRHLEQHPPLGARCPTCSSSCSTGMGFTPHTLVHMDGHEHTEHRKVTNDWFKPAAVKSRQDGDRRDRRRVRREAGRPRRRVRLRPGHRGALHAARDHGASSGSPRRTRR